MTLIGPEADLDLSKSEREHLAELGVATHEGPCEPLAVQGDAILVSVPGATISFDSVYPALGSDIRSECATGIGAEVTDAGCIVVDQHQRTTLSGLYAAGDVVKGLDQISHAMGEAGVAAIAIRNDLAQAAPLLRVRP